MRIECKGNRRLFNLNTLGFARHSKPVSVFTVVKFRALALRRSASGSSCATSCGGAGRRRRVILSQEAWTRWANRRGKVKWARKSVVVASPKVPVIVETARAREKLVSKETRRKRRSRCIGSDALLRWRLSERVRRASRACGEKRRGRGRGRREDNRGVRVVTLYALRRTLCRARRTGLASRAAGLRATVSRDLNSETGTSRTRRSAGLQAIRARGQGESRIGDRRG